MVIKVPGESLKVYYTVDKINLCVWGFVYVCFTGHYHIIINDRLSKNQQESVLAHEIKHIRSDLPNYNYIIGIDMQHSKFEKEADQASLFLST